MKMRSAEISPQNTMFHSACKFVLIGADGSVKFWNASHFVVVSSSIFFVCVFNSSALDYIKRFISFSVFLSEKLQWRFHSWGRCAELFLPHSNYTHQLLRMSEIWRFKFLYSRKCSRRTTYILYLFNLHRLLQKVHLMKPDVPYSNHFGFAHCHSKKYWSNGLFRIVFKIISTKDFSWDTFDPHAWARSVCLFFSNYC